MKFKLNVYWVKYQWEKEGKFEIHSVLFRDTSTHQFVKEFDTEVYIPQDFNPLDRALQELRAEKEKLLEKLKDVDNGLKLLGSI